MAAGTVEVVAGTAVEVVAATAVEVVAADTVAAAAVVAAGTAAEAADTKFAPINSNHENPTPHLGRVLFVRAHLTEPLSFNVGKS